MLIGLDQDKKRIFAHNANAGEMYECPMCNLDIKCMAIDAAPVNQYFLHKKTQNCHFSTGETKRRLQTKYSIYKSLKDSDYVHDLQLEPCFNNIRPDITCNIDGNDVAIEIQGSHMSVDMIEERLEEYTQQGLKTLWVLTDDEKYLDRQMIQPTTWEKYIHAIFLGRIYQWTEGSFVRPWHLSFIKEEEINDFQFEDETEKIKFEEKRVFKRKLTPSHKLNIANDFRYIYRDSCSIGNKFFIEGSMWVDTLKKWWD